MSKHLHSARTRKRGFWRSPVTESNEDGGTTSGILDTSVGSMDESCIFSKHILPRTVLTRIVKLRMTSALAKIHRRHKFHVDGQHLQKCSVPGCGKIISFVPKPRAGGLKLENRRLVKPMCWVHHNRSEGLRPCNDVLFTTLAHFIAKYNCTATHPCGCWFGVHMPGCHNHLASRNHWCNFCNYPRACNFRHNMDGYFDLFFRGLPYAPEIRETFHPENFHFTKLNDLLEYCRAQRIHYPHLWFVRNGIDLIAAPRPDMGISIETVVCNFVVASVCLSSSLITACSSISALKSILTPTRPIFFSDLNTSKSTAVGFGMLAAALVVKPLMQS